MFFDFLTAKGQAIVLFNCNVEENFLDCGCALFFTKTNQKLFHKNDLIKNGRKIIIPKNLQIETYARLLDSQDNIRLFFENI